MILLVCIQLDRAIQDLGAEDPAVREAAVAALERAGEEAVPLLRRALDSGDPEVRRLAELLLAPIDLEARLRTGGVRAPGLAKTLLFGDTPALTELLVAQGRGPAWTIEEFEMILGAMLEPSPHHAPLEDESFLAAAVEATKHADSAHRFRVACAALRRGQDDLLSSAMAALSIRDSDLQQPKVFESLLAGGYIDNGYFYYRDHPFESWMYNDPVRRAPEAAFRSLRNADPAVRIAALRFLAYYDGASVREEMEIVRLLKDPDAAVRQQAVESASQREIPEAIPAIVAAARDVPEAAPFLSVFDPADVYPHVRDDLRAQDPAVVRRALASLSNVSGGEAFEAVSALAAAADPAVRADAVRALSAASPEGRAVILAAIGDASAAVRAAAVGVATWPLVEESGRLDALLADEEPVLEALMTAMESGRLRAAAAAAVRLLDSENEDLRYRAVSIIYSYGGPDEAAAVLPHLDDPILMSYGIAILARHRVEGTVDALKRLALDGDDSKTSQAVSYLRQVGGPEAADALLEMAGHDVAGKYARAALAELRDTRVVPLLEARGEFWPLAQMDTGRAVRLAVESLKRDEPDRRASALSVLKSYGSTETAEAVAAILGDLDPDSLAGAFELLGAAQAGVVRPFLRDAKDIVKLAALSFVESRRDREAAGEAAALLTDASAEIRARAASVLVSIGGPEQVPALAAALGDGEPSVRQSAAYALGEIRDPRAVEALKAAMARAPAEEQFDYAMALMEQGDADGWVRALAETGERAWEAAERLEDSPPPATPETAALLLTHPSPLARRHGVRIAARSGHGIARLVERLADVDAQVRAGSLAALSAHGMRDSIGAMKARAADPSPAVRAAAVLAVNDLDGWTAAELEPVRRDPDADVRAAAAQVYASRGFKTPP